jgi:hypothetical protein
MYSIVIFHMTDACWNLRPISMTRHPNQYYHNEHEIRTTFHRHHSLIHTIISCMNHDMDRCCFLLRSIMSLYPIAHAIRCHVSHTIQSIVENETSNTIYAILKTPRLISLIQSNGFYDLLPMNASDINLLLHSIYQMKSLPSLIY